MELRPSRGGFLRPFGCGWFIREFLAGRGPEGSPEIDPERGAPQADIFYHYKVALHRAFALDTAVREEEARAEAEDRPIDPEKIAERQQFYLDRIPYKLTKCRYHSFLMYFHRLKQLGWVELTGEEEPSEPQQSIPAGTAPHQPRKYYRLSAKGRKASDVAWSNPLLVLYPERGLDWYREKRRQHKYVTLPSTKKRARAARAKSGKSK